MHAIHTHKIAIIQARMSSSRLPGKVLLEINGRPMLQHVIERTMRAKLVDDIIIATTTSPSDDLLEQFCQGKGIPCLRGSSSDVLDRYYKAALQFHADVVIRLTSDCPLLDASILDRTVAAFYAEPYSPGQESNKIDHGSTAFTLPELTTAGAQYSGAFDLSANRLPPPWRRTLPIGLDVEVCSFAALERAWKQADQLYQREHVMPYLYEGVVFSTPVPTHATEWYLESGVTARGMRVALLNHHPDYGSHRWTVDTPADLDFVRQVYSHFGAFEYFGWQQVLALLDEEPQLLAINSSVKPKSAFDVDQRSPQK